MRAKSLLVVLLCACTQLTAGTLLENMRRKIFSLQPFLVDFKQVLIHNEIREAEESGEIRFIDLKNQLWEYRRPEEKYFLLKDDSYRFYIVEDKQLLCGRISEIQANIFKLLLESSTTGLRVKESGRRITIELREKEMLVTLTVLVSRDFLPQSVRHVQDNGIVTDYEFSNYNSRKDLSAASLSLTPPADVEIIED